MFDIIQLLEISPLVNSMKVHLAIGRNDYFEPLKEFEKGNFKKWQEWQTKNNFNKYILSLLYYKRNVWLFAGVYKVLSINKITDDHFDYKTDLTGYGEKFIGRLLVNHEKTFRNSYPHLKTIIADLSFHSILEEKKGLQHFPGVKNIIIKFENLKQIIELENFEWKAGLSNLKGVYLITDTKTGKHYVGSATGKNTIWSRWKDYIETVHGNNEGLIELIREKGPIYANNLQFSILEVFGDEMNGIEVVRKENLWKRKLLSVEFGYNRN